MVVSQLFPSRGIRGENTLDLAEYLGYLYGKDLYLDFEFTKSEDYVKRFLKGMRRVLSNKKLPVASGLFTALNTRIPP